MAHSLSICTTKELQAELERRSSPKYKEILFDILEVLQDEAIKRTAESDTAAWYAKKIRNALKENLLPLD